MLRLCDDSTGRHSNKPIFLFSRWPNKTVSVVFSNVYVLVCWFSLLFNLSHMFVNETCPEQVANYGAMIMIMIITHEYTHPHHVGTSNLRHVCAVTSWIWWTCSCMTADIPTDRSAAVLTYIKPTTTAAEVFLIKVIQMWTGSQKTP